jgi:tripartite-type tricarboxylate transporter receptor subunit TctC
VLKAVAVPETAQRLLDQGYDVQGSTPEAFARLIQSDIAKYSKVIREANIQIE